MTFTQPDPPLPEKSSNHFVLAVSLNTSPLRLDPEFSYIEFNSQVHIKTHDKTIPISRKFDFADISNPNRFFMIHLDSLGQTLNSDINGRDPSGQTEYGQLDIVSYKAGNPCTEQYCCFSDKVLLAAPKPAEKAI